MKVSLKLTVSASFLLSAVLSSHEEAAVDMLMVKAVDTRELKLMQPMKPMGMSKIITRSPTIKPMKTPTKGPTADFCTKFDCSSNPFVPAIGCGAPLNCFCTLDVDGKGVCLDQACGDICDTSADCGAGEACVPDSCCKGKRCFCLCGACTK
jgi:hypothetical protein